MADMVRNENVTTLYWRYRPGAMYSTGQEKNRSDYIATEKAEGPIARFHETTPKNNHIACPVMNRESTPRTAEKAAEVLCCDHAETADFGEE
jgi:hypothetical protein